MSRGEWLKVIVLVIVPIIAWMSVLYHLHQQKRMAVYPSLDALRYNTMVISFYTAKKLGIKEGNQLVYPFPIGDATTVFLGPPPPVGKGHPVLFLNIDWNTGVEVWEPVIQESLNASPSLHIVLLFAPRPILVPTAFQKDIERLRVMLKHFSSPRISAIAGEWTSAIFGGFSCGIFAILCDGYGIIRAVEPYPTDLKFSHSWDEEVADWRPKLHQAVKKVLDKFFPKRSK